MLEETQAPLLIKPQILLTAVIKKKDLEQEKEVKHHPMRTHLLVKENQDKIHHLKEQPSVFQLLMKERNV